MGWGQAWETEAPRCPQRRGLCLHHCYPHSTDEVTEAQEGSEAHLMSLDGKSRVRTWSQGPSDTVTERDTCI